MVWVNYTLRVDRFSVYLQGTFLNEAIMGFFSKNDSNVNGRMRTWERNAGNGAQESSSFKGPMFFPFLDSYFSSWTPLIIPKNALDPQKTAYLN